MALSIADRPWRKWAIRAVAGFLLVYMLGAFGIPTWMPYVAVLLAVIVDAVRLAMESRRGDDLPPRRGRDATGGGETIH